jgi:hypothetical protein
MTLTDRIEIDPRIMLGKPVIRGTRIPVELVLRKLNECAPMLICSTPIHAFAARIFTLRSGMLPSEHSLVKFSQIVKALF